MEHEATREIGDRVWVRGKYATQFSLNGVIETIEDDEYGVRLSNGNFLRVKADQLQTRS